MMKQEKIKHTKKAFTLAEVLITIGIIGVVAVLVIVPFMKNINNKDLAMSATVFEKRLEEALKVMNTQDTLSGYKTTEDFVQGLAKNFKISKVCKNTELKQCFNTTIYDAEKNEIKTETMQTSESFGKEFETNIVGLRFGNGVNALLAYDPKCESNPTDNSVAVMGCVSMVYDVNGNGRPNKISSDVRLLNATLTESGVIATINGVKITGVAQAGTYPTVDCVNTDDKYCYGSKSSDKDYWAGAAKLCGGKENMASEDDLLNLAKYLYNDNSIKLSGDVNNLTKDTDRSLEFKNLGIANDYFCIWSSNSPFSTHARVRSFTENGTSSSGHMRNINALYYYTLCVKH